jgi:hypothetical protein
MALFLVGTVTDTACRLKVLEGVTRGASVVEDPDAKAAGRTAAVAPSPCLAPGNQSVENFFLRPPNRVRPESATRAYYLIPVSNWHTPTKTTKNASSPKKPSFDPLRTPIREISKSPLKPF